MKLSKTKIKGFEKCRNEFLTKLEIFFEGVVMTASFILEREENVVMNLSDFDKLYAQFLGLVIESNCLIPIEGDVDFDAVFGYKLRIYFEKINNEIIVLEMKGMDTKYLKKIYDEFCDQVCKIIFE